MDKLTDVELLKKYQEIALKLVEAKDDELRFIGDNPNRDFWSDEQDSDYDELLGKIEDLEFEFAKVNQEVYRRKF